MTMVVLPTLMMMKMLMDMGMEVDMHTVEVQVCILQQHYGNHLLIGEIVTCITLFLYCL